MNILFAASELSPLAKTGGLGDVLAALPPVLKKRGHAVACVLPLYRGLLGKVLDPELSPLTFPLRLGSALHQARIWTARTQEGVRLFLVQRDEFFDRSHLYGSSEGDYADNAARFIFFSKAVVELARYLQPVTQILHLHDWQTGLVPALVKSANLPLKSVFTIHNLAYQGAFWGLDFGLTNLRGEYFTQSGVEFYGHLNLMKAGIVLANEVTTVSPRYAEEIQTEGFGCGLHRVLQEHRHKLTGILNGVDYERWNPSTDPFLAATYTPSRLKGKAACKLALQKDFGLKENEAPLFACITRLAQQKGAHLIADLMEELLNKGASFVLLGSGDVGLENHFRYLAHKYPHQVAVSIGFDESLSHRIEAAADFFLMPSQYEPCGLTQMYSLRYGAIPIAHRTGGLADSIVDYVETTGEGTGFLFSPHDVGSLRFACDRALNLYARKPEFNALRKQGMKVEFSWDRSAESYEQVYTRALAS
jgi:starch synthase